MPRLLPLVAACLSLTSCLDNNATATFDVGDRFTLSASTFALPTELREDTASGPKVRAVSCGPMGMCPSSSEVAIVCDGGTCDPAPQTVTAPAGEVLDFEALAAGISREGDGSGFFRSIDSVEILEINYAITENTLTVGAGEVELFWGPPGAVDVDPAMGVVKLGTVPPISVGETGMGAVVLDGAGVSRLSDHLVGPDARVRFFIRTVVDLDPGSAFPEGLVQVAVTLKVRVSGPVL